MAVIKLKQLEAGAVLSADVLDMNGRVLLRSGSTISSKHLEIFRAWGVAEVTIAGDPHELDEMTVNRADIPPEQIAAVEAELQQRFQFTDCNHPAIHEIRQNMVLRRARQQLTPSPKPH